MANTVNLWYAVNLSPFLTLRSKHANLCILLARKKFIWLLLYPLLKDIKTWFCYHKIIWHWKVQNNISYLILSPYWIYYIFSVPPKGHNMHFIVYVFWVKSGYSWNFPNKYLTSMGTHVAVHMMATPIIREII